MPFVISGPGGGGSPGPSGPAGKPGQPRFTGVGPPDNLNGDPDDVYMDLTSGQLYQWED